MCNNQDNDENQKHSQFIQHWYLQSRNHAL